MLKLRLTLSYNMIINASLAFLLFLISYLHVIFVPYTKVEESFTLQAIHDTLAFGIGPRGKERFDHIIFSGAVPRSFVGPILIAIISYPVLVFSRVIGLVKSSADTGLFIRLTLTSLHAFSVLFFGSLIIRSTPTTKQKNQFIQTQKRLFYLVYSIQFHPLYWAGRTTPNGVILPAVIIGLALLFWQPKPQQKQFIVYAKCSGISILTASAIISRLEIVGVLLPIVIWTIWKGELANEVVESIQLKGKTVNVIESKSNWEKKKESFKNVLICGILTSFLALTISSPLDTYMWNRPFKIWSPFNPSSEKGLAWPEFEAIIFNVVEGKSSEWGISIWHEYITVHLAKLISFPCLALVGLGILAHLLENSQQRNSQISKCLVVIGSHIFIMSQLGHKETRFITYLTPLLNFVAAFGATKLWCVRGNGIASLRSICRLLVVALFSLTTALTLISLIASYGNYPGGEALKRLHELLQEKENSTVHIDVLPSMTGVSLFQSLHLIQRYSRKGSFGLSALPNVFFSNDNKAELMWAYDKTENLFDGDKVDNQSALPIIATFTHIVSDKQNCHFPSMFEQIPQQEGKGFKEFERLKILGAQTYIKNLRTFVREIPHLVNQPQSLFLLLPFEFKWREVVWLCQKKHASF